MSSSQSFVRVLGQPLGNAIHICQVTSASTTSKIGLQLSVTQQSGLDRNYRVNISPSIATGFGVWKRLVPYDKTEKFINQNHWAVDLSNEVSESIHTITLRLVRTKEGTPPATTSLKCRVLAFPSVGQSVNFVDSQTTSAEAVNAGIYDGALISQQDGMVGINTDSPSHILDVLGNVNISERYKIGGTDVLSATALGTSVLHSNLTTLGTLSALNVTGNVSAGNLSVGNTTLRVDAVARKVSVGGYDGQWTLRTSAADHQWTSVTYGNGLYVAVAQSGTGTRVMTSPNGSTWTLRNSAADASWNSVTYGNGLFVAVAPNAIMTSPNGITWTSRTSPSNLDWRSVTYGNGRFLAVSYVNGVPTGGTLSMAWMTSSDGISWTSFSSPPLIYEEAWISVAYGNNQFLVINEAGPTVSISVDGQTFLSSTTSESGTFRSLTYGNGSFVGVGNFGVVYVDGGYSRPLGLGVNWESVTYGNGLFVAVASNGTGNRIATSPDGVTWTLGTSPADNTWTSVTYGNGIFVAVSSDGSGNRVMTSSSILSDVVVSGNLRAGGEIVSVGNVEIRYPVDESKRWRIISSTDATGDFLQIESFVNSAWTGYMRIDK